LLLLRRGFGTRQMFDAACQLTRLDPVIAFESGAAHILLALAETGLGAAILPSTVRTGGRPLRISRLTCRGEPVEADFLLLWDGRRPLPRYAEGFPRRSRRMCAGSGRSPGHRILRAALVNSPG
jgi:DNA-binding transcriptional LysR family regulator